MNFIEALTIIAALMIIGTTIMGAPTHDWQVYCWMGALISWVMVSRDRRIKAGDK